MISEQGENGILSHKDNRDALLHIRVKPRLKAELERQAAERNVRPTTLAREILAAGLRR